MLDTNGGRPPKRLKAQEALEQVFHNEAKVNARRQLVADPWRGR